MWFGIALACYLMGLPVAAYAATRWRPARVSVHTAKVWAVFWPYAPFIAFGWWLGSLVERLSDLAERRRRGA